MVAAMNTDEMTTDAILAALIAVHGYGPTLVVTGSGVFAHMSNTMWWGESLSAVILKVAQDMLYANR